MPKQSGVADLIVKGAIALVTVAFFIGAYLQFQVTFWMALIAALSVYIMLLMVHALMRRTEREGDLVYEVNRLEDEVARLKVAPPAAGSARANERPPAFAPPRPPDTPGLRCRRLPPMPPLARPRAPAPCRRSVPPSRHASSVARRPPAMIEREPPLTSLARALHRQNPCVPIRCFRRRRHHVWRRSGPARPLVAGLVGAAGTATAPGPARCMTTGPLDRPSRRCRRGRASSCPRCRRCRRPRDRSRRRARHDQATRR